MGKTGRLDVICGPMFSGKTDELIDHFERAVRTRRRIVAVKPVIDGRHPPDLIVSHSRRTIPAESASAAEEVAAFTQGVSVLLLDEIQFFSLDLSSAVDDVRGRGINVVAAGLDLDFRRHPFEVTAALIADSSSVTRMAGSCSRCGKPASVTQRFQNGTPVPLEDARLVVGDAGTYEPRCVSCWELERAGLEIPANSLSVRADF